MTGPLPDDAVPPAALVRHENSLERADRNWEELLGELRVTETGVAILFSVLLTVPFSARFDQANSGQQSLYLVALLLSAATLVTLIAPVACHRILFARGQKPGVVKIANRLTVIGLGLLCLTLGTVLMLVTDFLVDASIAIVVSLIFTIGTAALWFVPAWALRESGRSDR